MLKKYELQPIFDSRKSFYGKAKVEENRGARLLRSYDTDVCMIDADGVFHRLWSGYSATTMRHVNEFLAQQGHDGGGAAWWRKQPVERFSWVDFYAGALA